MASLFPQAELFTLVSAPAGVPKSLVERRWHTSFLQKIPLARRQHRHFLPLYPLATECLDLRGFDLLLSSDSGPVKGVTVRPGTPHLCYCHSPMRYLWDGFEAYRKSMGPLTRMAFSLAAPGVRRWDDDVAQKVTWFLANSEYVKDRIQRCYGREAEVVPPPIDLHRAEAVRGEAPGEHYLCAGRLVAYKRAEVLLEACRRLGRKLRIAGAGPELEKLKAMAAGDERVTFLGELPTDELWREYARCRALLFAADEDFGMIPLEVQACGRPVIAYGTGGSLETVRGCGEQRTGTYFNEQTPEAAAEAIEHWERELETRFRPEDARSWAAGFATPVFLERYRQAVLERVPQAAAEMVSTAEAMEALD